MKPYVARTSHKDVAFPVGGGLPPSFFVRQVKSQNLAAKAAPTGVITIMRETRSLDKTNET